MAGNEENFRKLMDQGSSAAWEQKWDDAAHFYQQALEEMPDNPQALTNLGLALFEMQDFKSALTYYQKTAALNPSDPVPVEKIANIHERLGHLPEAAQSYMQSAELFLKTRDVDKTIDNWLQAISIQPENLMARTRLASIYDKMGRKADAVIEYLAVASLMQQAGDVTKAYQVVEYVLKIMPEYAEAKQALNLLKNNQPLPKPPRPHGGTAAMRMAEVKHLDAPKITTALKQDPISEARQRALVKLAALLFEANEEAHANGQIARRGITTLTRGTGGLSPEVAERARIQLHLNQAIEAQTQGNLTVAAEELERAVEIGLSRAEAFFDLGLLLCDTDEQKTMRYLQQSVNHPDFALGSYLLMGKVMLNTGRFSEAAIAYLHALSLADVELAGEEHADELRQLYETIFEAQSNEKDEAVLRKLCETISNQLMRADWRDYLTKARQELPQQSEGSPLMPLAEMLLETSGSQVVEALAQIRQLAGMKKYRSAMEEAFTALPFAPTYLPLHTQMGELLISEGRTTEAVEKFLITSQLYSLRGEAAQAVRLLNRVTQMAPMDLSIRSRLIELLTSQGRTDEALEQYVGLADIYYHLAELDMARQTYMAGLNLAQQSKANRKWMVQILNKLADIDSQRLDWRNALRMYEQLRTLVPEDAGPHTHLVDLNLRLGQTSNAMAELDGYLTLLDNSGQSAKCIEFLKSLLEDRPKQVEFLQRLAEVYTRGNQNNLAIETLDAMADSLMLGGNKPAAIEAIKKIIALNPPNAKDYQAALATISK